MSDAWRNRYMAPAYALVISFVIVLILGMMLGDRKPSTPGGTTTPTITDPRAPVGPITNSPEATCPPAPGPCWGS